MNKFFYSRRLRASPQGSSPWTSVALLLELPSLRCPLRCADACERHGNLRAGETHDRASGRTQRGRKLSEERNRGPGRGALGRRPQATTAKKLVRGPEPATTAKKTCSRGKLVRGSAAKDRRGRNGRIQKR